MKVIYCIFFLLFIGKALYSQEIIPQIKKDTTSCKLPYEVIGAVSADPQFPNQAGLEDMIHVQIRNCSELICEAEKQKARILIYLNEIPLKDAVSSRDADGLTFYLPHDGDVIDAWNLFISMREKNNFFFKDVALSVGIEGEGPIPTQVIAKKAFTLILVRKNWFVVCIGVILIILIMFVALAKQSDMLRDSGLQPLTGRKPYSLSRMQMAIWFIVIISSWLLLYVCLHRFNNLSESTLILLGITAGTSIGCVALDTNKEQTVCAPSRGFFTDLVSHNSTVSLFRFQNLAWTIVLVLVFVRQVVFYLKMPEFDSTLLLLMGISSGTYIGGKVTEKKEEQVVEVKSN